MPRVIALSPATNQCPSATTARDQIRKTTAGLVIIIAALDATIIGTAANDLSGAIAPQGRAIERRHHQRWQGGQREPRKRSKPVAMYNPGARMTHALGPDLQNGRPRARVAEPETKEVVAPVPTTSCPSSWFLNLLHKKIKGVVRPCTALTRCKEIVLTMSLPRDCVETFMSPLTETDSEGLKRDATTAQFKPTSKTSPLLKFEL